METQWLEVEVTVGTAKLSRQHTSTHTYLSDDGIFSGRDSMEDLVIFIESLWSPQ